jgi:AAA15 family ATPase/GTPase
MKGNIETWLNKHQLNATDIPFFKDNRNDFIVFQIDFVDQPESSDTNYWVGTFVIPNLCCIAETVQLGNKKFTTTNTTDNKNYSIQEDGKETLNKPINFKYQGSIFSQLADDDLAEFDEFRDSIKNIQTFGLLNPQSLKQNSKKSPGSIGFEGEFLSAFMHYLDETQHVNITQKLKSVYPYFGDFKTKVLPDESKELSISENFHNGNGTYSSKARNTNDGLLRTMAVLAELETKHQILLFDEIENGINPELIGFLLKELTESNKQIIVTTHSPMILNYLDDDIAISGVHYFYKTSAGHTQSIPFFEIPSMREKLEMMGSGEVYIDTNLTELSEDAEKLLHKEEAA